MVTPVIERVVFHARTRSAAVGDNLASVQLQRLHSENPVELRSDSVVFIWHNRGVRDLADSLSDLGLPVIPVGRAASPRYLDNAMQEGHMAARSLWLCAFLLGAVPEFLSSFAVRMFPPAFNRMPLR